MRNAYTGIAFFTCLSLGAGLGFFFGNFEVGGALGLCAGLGVIAVFRKSR